MAKKKTAAVESHSWKFPSNHQNLLFMLGKGLMTGPKGFEYEGESKYYKDALSLCQGCIPLFRKSIPADITALSTEEVQGSIPVTAQVSMENFHGKVYVFAGDTWELTPYADIAAEIQLIAVPAPLPTAWISHVTLDNENDMAVFRRSADDLENVEVPDLHILPLGPSGDGSLPLMREHNLGVNAFKVFPPVGETDAQMRLVEKAQALGGIVAMLYLLADNSALGVEIFKKTRAVLLNLSSCGAGSMPKTDDVIMKELPRWIAGENMPAGEWRISFFFGLLDCIIESRRMHGPTGLTSVSRTYVMHKLNSADGLHNWPKGPKLLEEISAPTLRLSELFEKFPGTISHALLIFFHGEHCEDLLGFQSKNPHVVLSDADVTAAALLFGAREGWSGLTNTYRRGLSKWITALMASKSHSSDSTIISFNTGMLKPLRELFTDENGEIHQKRALDAARKYKWQECLLTKIKLPKSYRVEEGYITLPGDEAAKVIVKDNALYAKLRDASPEEKDTLRKNLGDVE